MAVEPSTQSSRRVLVTDGEQRASLAVVRSLGAAGDAVFVCSSRGKSVSGSSRHAAAEDAVADALADPDQFALDVAAITRARRIDTLIPISEAALLALLPVRDRFDGVCIPFTQLQTFQNICDKGAVLEAARRVGLAVPEQHVVHTAADVSSFDLESLQFPVVVKPARSVSQGKGRRLKTAVEHAANSGELQKVLLNSDPAAYPLLVQQRVVGPGVGIFLLVSNGKIVASFSHRRIREKPPSGGVSVYRESIPADPKLVQLSAVVLAEFGWEGVAMVEFKLDARTGCAYLMEINGRFWGSLQLAIDAGVDFPCLLLQTCTDAPLTPVTTYEAGIRLRWFWGEVDHLVARFRSSDAQLALPPGSPSRSAAARDFFRRHPGDFSEILRRDDPKPFVRESIDWVRQLIGK